ncbi:MAG: hypothetical protein EOP84_07600 [Verrucomicrobiaceae bacterium]|nr:MAG: hypothetical protein EOP84_07600 [Verrucomicrobiaceae bacterium]
MSKRIMGIAANYSRWVIGFEYQTQRDEWEFYFGPYLWLLMRQVEGFRNDSDRIAMLATPLFSTRLDTNPRRLMIGVWFHGRQFFYGSFYLGMFSLELFRSERSIPVRVLGDGINSYLIDLRRT